MQSIDVMKPLLLQSRHRVCKVSSLATLLLPFNVEIIQNVVTPIQSFFVVQNAFDNAYKEIE